MTTRNLAYIALLAGWICFCYWLYAEGIYPRLQGTQEKSWPEYSAKLPFPLAFRWGSAVPLSGQGFGEMKAQFENLDTTDALLIITGYFFRDEAADTAMREDLGHRRIDSILGYLDIDRRRIVTAVSVQEITADVRSNPFEALRFERIRSADIMTIGKDTLEICFPLKDSFVLPQICVDRLETWLKDASKTKERMVHIVGTADGSGIAEPLDMAMERAMIIKETVINTGWKDEQIHLFNGQRSNPLTLSNRCVVLYFE